MRWQEQSWLKLSKLPKNMPVVIPVGSCEQHGKHLPLFVDTLQVHHIAEEAHKQLENEILLVPTLWLGSSHHHKDFPGTISVLPELYSQMIQQIARCVLNAGFTNIVFLNGHGGNHVPIGQALSELVIVDDEADAANIVLATWWVLAATQLQADKIGMATRGISHACEYETSTTLAIRPDLVDMSQIPEVAGHENLPPFHEPQNDIGVSVFHRFHRFSSTGHLGYPKHATAEKGKKIFEVVSQRLVEVLREMAQATLPPKQGPR
jgi:creatinine amidohydrolase